MSNEQPAIAPILTVTWDTAIGTRHVGGDYHEPEFEPVSLGEMVVTEIVRQLIDEVRRDIRDEVRKAVLPTIQAEVAQVVREALTGEIQRTNRWGETEGEPTTLRDLIADDVKAYLAEPAKKWHSDERKNGFRELLREQVDEVMKRELTDEVKKARAAVAKQVADKAAQLFGDVVKATR